MSSATKKELKRKIVLTSVVTISALSLVAYFAALVMAGFRA